MNKLLNHDLQFALRRAPKALLETMKEPEWLGKIYVGGGYLRSIVSGDPVNDIDVFVSSKDDAVKLAQALIKKFLGDGLLAASLAKTSAVATDNALTVTCFKTTIQIISRWVFNSPEDVSKSFDFTCCCAVFARYGQKWETYCDERFYPDVAAKRLVYRSPQRNEDAGGSMLRVLKYYQKGYRIPLDSLGAVVARLLRGVKEDNVLFWEGHNESPQYAVDSKEVDEYRAKIVTGLLREVDPNIDPEHVAHLPMEEEPFET